MIRYLTAITAAVILSTGAAAQSIQLKSLPAGSNLTFVAQASSEIPNDLAVMVFSAVSESEDLPTAQSNLNGIMAEAQKTISDFSSLAKIRNYGYSAFPVYSKPKAGQAPEIVGWKAVQRIQVQTEDIEGVPALVQTAQNAKLALDNINYGLTKATKELTQEKLIGMVVENVNKKAANVALAMKLPVETFYIEKLEFNQGFDSAPRNFAVRSMMAADSSAGVTMPSFEAGTSNVELSARASLKILPDNPQ